MATRNDTMFAWLRGRYGRRMELVLSGHGSGGFDDLRVFVSFWSQRPRVTALDLDGRVYAQHTKAVSGISLPDDTEEQYRRHMSGYWRSANDDTSWRKAISNADFHSTPLGVYGWNQHRAVLYVADGVPPQLLLSRFGDAIQ